MSTDYKGWTELDLNDEQLAAFYTDQKNLKHSLLENEYVLLKHDGNIVDKFCYQHNFLRQVNYNEFTSDFSGQLKPRNIQQELAFDMLRDKRSVVKLITGGFGTGKTLALCAGALEAIQKGQFEKIVWVRNNVQVKDTDQLGALPGSDVQKILPYAMPLADHCGGVEGLMSLIDSGRLDIIPLGFLRGRSIRNSIIISSEAENLTKQHIQLLIGRIDEGSNLWFDADVKQRDKAAFEESRGVELLIERLKGNPLFAYVKLIKTERSQAAALADLLD